MYRMLYVTHDRQGDGGAEFENITSNGEAHGTVGWKPLSTVIPPEEDSNVITPPTQEDNALEKGLAGVKNTCTLHVQSFKASILSHCLREP